MNIIKGPTVMHNYNKCRKSAFLESGCSQHCKLLWYTPVLAMKNNVFLWRGGGSADTQPCCLVIIMLDILFLSFYGREDCVNSCMIPESGHTDVQLWSFFSLQWLWRWSDVSWSGLTRSHPGLVSHFKGSYLLQNDFISAGLWKKSIKWHPSKGKIRKINK